MAQKFAAEGCNVAINYAAREAPARELAERIEGSFGVKTLVIQGVS